jgi:hypothetical protein
MNQTLTQAIQQIPNHHPDGLTLQRYFPNDVILSDRRERRISFLASNCHCKTRFFVASLLRMTKP